MSTVLLAVTQAYEQELQKAMAVPLPDAGASQLLPSSFCQAVALCSGSAASAAASAILFIADCLWSSLYSICQQLCMLAGLRVDLLCHCTAEP
jgi:hypothetical protein